MSPPINLDGDTVDAITMDGDSVSEVTVDGDTVFSAIPDTLVDSFEDQDLTEYSGDTGAFTVNQTFVKQGDYGLEGGATNGGASTITSSSGLSYYPDGTDPYRIYVRWADADARLVIFYGQQDDNNRYRVDISNGRLQIGVRNSGSFTSIDSNSSPGLSANTDYDLEIDWTPGGTHTATVYDTNATEQAQASGSESVGISQTGIGFNVNDTGSNGVTGFFDYARAGGEPAGPP